MRYYPKDKEFLSGNDVKDFLDGLYHKGVDLHAGNAVLENTPVENTRNKSVEQSRQISDWFDKQFDVSKALFSGYLKIDKK